MDKITLLTLLKARAKAQYGVITPCAGTTWSQCLTMVRGSYSLWFNDATGSTHLIH